MPKLTPGKRQLTLIFVSLLFLTIILLGGYLIPQIQTGSTVAAIPTWPVPALSQATAEDWARLKPVSPAAGVTLPAGASEVVLQVDYSLHSRPEADLLIQLKSRLDLDAVDLGSDLSNLVAWQTVPVRQGTGAEIVRLSVEPERLAKFPPGSQVIPVATLLEREQPAPYFQQAFEEITFTNPDFSQACAFDPAHDSLEVIAVTPPAGGEFTEATPKAQVTLRYILTTPHPELLTLVGGLVNPRWDGQTTELTAWQQQAGAPSFQPLEAANGTITLDLYAWFPTPSTHHIVDQNGQVALALALVCGYDAPYQATISYLKIFPEHTFTFSTGLLAGLKPATAVPTTN